MSLSIESQVGKLFHDRSEQLESVAYGNWFTDPELNRQKKSQYLCNEFARPPCLPSDVYTLWLLCHAERACCVGAFAMGGMIHSWMGREQKLRTYSPRDWMELVDLACNGVKDFQDVASAQDLVIQVQSCLDMDRLAHIAYHQGDPTVPRVWETASAARPANWTGDHLRLVDAASSKFSLPTYAIRDCLTALGYREHVREYLQGMQFAGRGNHPTTKVESALKGKP